MQSENKNQIFLNTARNCLRYIVKAYKISEIFVPYYTCPVVWQSLKKENCKINFYHIDESFMPTQDFNKDAFVLYTNYFGICSKNVKTLSLKYKNLIVDNAHAFYMPQFGLASFSSLRKFFEVSDGAILYCEKEFDEVFETACDYDFSDFTKNEIRLNDEPIKFISQKTKNKFKKLDFDKLKNERLENFYQLHKILNEKNLLKIKLEKDDVPMIYPYLSRMINLRKILAENKIFLEQFWNPISHKGIEAEFQKYILPLPLVSNNFDFQKLIKLLD